MTMPLRTTLSALGLIAVFVMPLAAAEGATSPTPEVVNAVCPMDGKAIDPMKAKMVMLTVGEGADAKKYSMAFCSEEECSMFKRDPGSSLKTMLTGPKGGETRRSSTP